MANPSSSDILALLTSRHARDLYVAECPLEPWGNLRADLWVMRKSWSKPLTTIYEIKVSRSDFLRDDKWTAYLNYCNAMFFAVPRGVLSVDELPAGVGLLELSANGNMLRTVRKAAPRDDVHESQAMVMKAVLMNRATICGPRYGQSHVPPATRDQRIAEWRELVESGDHMGRLVRGAVARKIKEANDRADQADHRAAKCEDFRSRLLDHGIDPDMSTWAFARKLSELTQGDLQRSLIAVRAEIDRAISEMGSGNV